MKAGSIFIDHIALATALVVLALVLCLQAQTSAPGPLQVPPRTLPVPTTVSPQMQALVGAPLSSTWNVVPQLAEEWKAMSAPSSGRGLPALRERFDVKSEPLEVNGVHA